MRVFLSYAHEDTDTAAEVAALLRQEGHLVFLDRDRLQAGAPYVAAIRSSIADSDLFLALLSPESLEAGSFARHEVEVAGALAGDARRGVLPVLLREVDPRQVPAWLRALTFFRPSGHVAADVAHEVWRRLPRSLGVWMRHGLRGRAVPAAALAALLVVAPLGALAAGLSPPWPESASLLLGLAWVGEGLGFLFAVSLARFLGGGGRSLWVGVAALLLLAASAGYVLDHQAHVEQVGRRRVLTLPLEPGTAHDGVREEIHRAMDAWRRGEIDAQEGYESEAAALRVWRNSKGWDPALVWTRPAVAWASGRLLLGWAAWPSLLALLLGGLVLRLPAPRGRALEHAGDARA